MERNLKTRFELSFIDVGWERFSPSELSLKSPPCHSTELRGGIHRISVHPHLVLFNFLTLDNLMVVKWVLLLFPFALLYS